jgi:DNA-binding PadR family transcriptional regulator
MARTGLASGTVYPILSRLERRGLIVGKWPTPIRPSELGKPPRKNYTLTDSGRAELAEAVRPSLVRRPERA